MTVVAVLTCSTVLRFCVTSECPGCLLPGNVGRCLRHAEGGAARAATCCTCCIWHCQAVSL